MYLFLYIIDREGLPKARWYLHRKEEIIGKEDQDWNEILQEYWSWFQDP
jgi:hypothetical protein